MAHWEIIRPDISLSLILDTIWIIPLLIILIVMLHAFIVFASCTPTPACDSQTCWFRHKDVCICTALNVKSESKIDSFPFSFICLGCELRLSRSVDDLSVIQGRGVFYFYISRSRSFGSNSRFTSCFILFPVSSITFHIFNHWSKLVQELLKGSLWCI